MTNPPPPDCPQSGGCCRSCCRLSLYRASWNKKKKKPPRMMEGEPDRILEKRNAVSPDVPRKKWDCSTHLRDVLVLVLISWNPPWLGRRGPIVVVCDLWRKDWWEKEEEPRHLVRWFLPPSWFVTVVLFSFLFYLEECNDEKSVKRSPHDRRERERERLPRRERCRRYGKMSFCCSVMQTIALQRSKINISIFLFQLLMYGEMGCESHVWRSRSSAIQEPHTPFVPWIHRRRLVLLFEYTTIATERTIQTTADVCDCWEPH